MDDRISTLPDDILHHILSFLPAEEAVATSALSKRWRPLWLSFTTLSLHSRMPRFVKKEDDSMPIWQRLKFDLPCSIFRCRALVVLKLSGRSVRTFYNFDFPSLKTLHLDHVRFSRNRFLIALFNGCPNLEHLEAHEVRVKGGTSEGEYNGLLPKLVSASISAACKLNIPPLTALSNVQFLRLEPVPKVVWSRVLDMLKICPKLQKLVIDKPRGNLMYIFHYAEYFCYPDAVPECLCSQFRNCTIENYGGTKFEKLFVEYIMQNSSSLETLTIHSIPSMLPAEKHRILTQLSLCPKRSASCVVSFQ